jgi:ABC-2 type transport system ATP-binding protein
MRGLLRALAAEGRAVLVSSHLLREMEETADRVLVLGRGRLVADTEMRTFREEGSASHVRVVSPDAEGLAALLERAGATVARDTQGALAVTALGAPAIGDLAAQHGLRVHELTPRAATLEDAYAERTRDSVELRARVLP